MGALRTGVGAAAILFLGAAGCTSSANAPTPIEAGNADATTGVDVADAGGTLDATQAEDAPDDTGDDGDGAGDCAVLHLMPDDPPQPVSFQLTNASTVDRYVATMGADCEPYLVDDFDVVGQPSPFCEGPDATTSYIQLARVPAGGSATLTWDGLHAVPYQVMWQCPDFGPSSCGMYAVTVRRAVAPGSHQVTFRVLDTTCPGGCNGPLGGLCDPAVDGGASRQVTVTFDLPATAPIHVDVSMP